jgi:SAM-dependent methyltransferase
MTTSEPIWEQFAQEDPLYYVDMAHDGTPERFWAEGRASAQDLLSRAEPYLTDAESVTEIGCGVGRLLIPTAQHFRQAAGVDVAPTMLKLLREHSRQEGLEIDGFLPDEAWDARTNDLIYSKIVFRHIADRSILKAYVARIAGALAPTGVAVLDFDTRPKTIPYRLRNQVPDLFLPRTWRRGARGTRRSSDTLRRWFSEYGLDVIEERAPESGAHEFILRPAGAGRESA